MTAVGSDVVVALAAARRAIQLYPPVHPAYGEGIQLLVDAVTGATAGGPFALNLHLGRLYDGSVVLPDDAHGVPQLVEAFESRSIESLTFQPGFGEADAIGLTEVLSLRPSPSLDIAAELGSRGAAGVAVTFLADTSEPSRELEERERQRERDRAMYQRLVAAFRSLSAQLAAGSGGDLSQASGLVEGLLGRMMDDPAAVLGLATMRGASERTLFHSLNVMIYTLALGQRLGLPEEGLQALGTAALLHDIGKSAFDIGDMMQADAMHHLHPRVGAEILQRLALENPAPMLVAYEHHMNVDGAGFPERPADYIAHPYSRMVSIANRFENLTNPAQGRDALTPDRAVVQVLREAGSMLDPFFARLFASALGVFPVGCLVRLSDQSVGIVARPGEDPLAPVVRLAYDPKGKELDEHLEVDLAEGDVRIVEVFAPESLNIEVSDKL